MSSRNNNKARGASPADYAPEIEGIEFGELRAEVTGGRLDTEVLLAALRAVASMQRDATWWVGDLLAFGEANELSYAEAAEATGYGVGSLRNMAYVSRRVPPEIRVPGLHWRTHKMVAPIEDREEQRSWLRLAVVKGMTSDEVGYAIRASSSGDGEFEDPEAGATVCPYCNGSGTLSGAGS